MGKGESEPAVCVWVERERVQRKGRRFQVDWWVGGDLYAAPVAAESLRRCAGPDDGRFRDGCPRTPLPPPVLLPRVENRGASFQGVELNQGVHAASDDLGVIAVGEDGNAKYIGLVLGLQEGRQLLAVRI